jgi:chemotaxis receptor (MCP) glutamine deamidase CheD
MDQSDIDRYRHERPTRFVMPGYLIVEAEPVVLKTVLGSCVSVCLHDRDRHYGGMNHYLLAEDRPSEPVERYGRTAIRGLVRAFTDRGSLIPSLSAHIVGGAGMIHTPSPGPSANRTSGLPGKSWGSWASPWSRRTWAALGAGGCCS